MEYITIKLTEEESALFEYALFQYRGIELNFRQFIYTDYVYSEDHYNRIINTLIEKYSILQKQLYKILENHNYKNININKEYDFLIDENVLTIYTK
jgi:hypothetical protein